MSQFRKDVFYVSRGIFVTFAILLAIATFVGATILGLASLLLGNESSLGMALFSGMKDRVPIIALLTTSYWSLFTYLGGIGQRLGKRISYLSGAIALITSIFAISS